MIERHMVTTAFDLPGHRIERSFGVARGIIVRSRSIVGALGASLQTIFGGNITLYTSLCERARQDAYERMIAQAADLGANGIIGMRYDATEIARGITEVLCYGTAVPRDVAGLKSLLPISAENMTTWSCNALRVKWVCMPT